MFLLMKIYDIYKKYSPKIDHLDLELIIAHVIKKPREFVLAHPEFSINNKQGSTIEKFIKRRMKHEPLAYILGRKEFYGLEFKVDRHTLIPRPETELLVELAIQEIKTKQQKTSIIDIGTGSGNIIISIAKNSKQRSMINIDYFGTDISKEALRIAKYNSKKHNLDQRIKFLHGDLIGPILKKKLITDHCSLIIVANLPYLSKEIYDETLPDVKKYEPRSALFSPQKGLAHYDKLLSQIKYSMDACFMLHASCFMEISPEQKPNINKLIKSRFPQAKIDFYKDLAGKWRVCKIAI